MGKRSRKRRTQDPLEEYLKQEDAELRFESYVKLLDEVKIGIISGTLSTLEKAWNTLCKIHSFETPEVLLSFHNQHNSPFCGTNIVILSCKHEQLEVLKYLLVTSGPNLSSFYGKIGLELIHPSSQDAFKHSAFYYAVRFNNIQLVETLIAHWPGYDFTQDALLLEEELSTNYAELRMKNIMISEEMEMFIEGKLLELRFFVGRQKMPVVLPSVDDVKKRMDLMIDVINNTVSEGLLRPYDELTFFHNIKFIAQNIHVLKRLMKPTYSFVPWEEMEFCLITFSLSKYRGQSHQSFGRYCCFISTTTMVSHLKNFVDCLKSEHCRLLELLERNTAFPAMPRSQVKQTILSHYPCLEHLYQDFEQSRDIWSLDLMRNYIGLSCEANANEKSGRLVIIRSLQMIGELMKSTLMTPNLSESMSSQLFSHLTKTTRNVVVQLRDSFFHGGSLYKRLEVEEEASYDVFSILQTDLSKMRSVVNYILQQNLLQVTEELLKMLLETSEPVLLSEISNNLGGLSLQLKNFPNLLFDEFDGKVVSELKNMIPEPTDHEKSLINSLKKSTSKMSTNWSGLWAIISIFAWSEHIGLSYNINHTQSSLKHFGARAMRCLLTCKACLTEQRSLVRSFLPSLMILQRVDEVLPLIQTFLGTSTLVHNFDAEGVEELHNDLKNLDGSSGTNSKMLNSILPQKLDELKTAMVAKPDTKTDRIARKEGNNQDLCLTSNPTQSLSWLVHLEMLLMDTMAILDSSKHRLVNNLGSLDVSSPTVYGKVLRDHLAHGNSILNLLLHNSSTSVVTNALFLITKRDDLISSTHIGRAIWKSAEMIKKQYDAASSIACYQQQLFKSLQEGDMETVKLCIENGADISGRTSNLMTALHYAAMSLQVGPLNFILAQWTDSIYVLNCERRNPLHLAASYGCVENVIILLKDGRIPIDSFDFCGKTPLHLSAEAGQVDVIRVLLDNKANPKVFSQFGKLPVMEAMLSNQFEAAKLLLEQHNIYDTLTGGFTFLHAAAEGGATDVINFLVRIGADVNAPADRGGTPLHLASFFGHLESVKALVAHGADVNAPSSCGTALHMACENEHNDVVQYLLDQNANVNAHNDDNFSPIFHASVNGNIETLKLLLRKNANFFFVWSPYKRTLLHAALTEHRNEEVVKFLLTKSTHWINSQDAFGQVPLHYCAHQGDPKSIDTLIGYGAEIDIRDQWGHTAVFVAVLSVKTEALECLITHGANVNIVDNAGHSPLELSCLDSSEEIAEILIKEKTFGSEFSGGRLLLSAIRNCSRKIVELLLENGASVNEAHQGVMPLHLAVCMGWTEMVDILCVAGANIDEVDGAGLSPFQSACLTGHYSIATALIHKGCKINLKVEDFKKHPVTLAIKSKVSKMIGLLLKVDVQIEPAHLEHAVTHGTIEVVSLLLNHFPQQALSSQLVYIATHKSRRGVLKLLLKKGLDANITRGGSLDTPLHLAGTRDAAIAGLLIDYSADPNKRNAEGWTPLHVAVIAGNLEVTKVLLDAGADISLNSAVDSCSALQLATMNGHLEMIKLLIQRGADLHYADSLGRKAVHFAAHRGFRDLVDFFISECQVDIYDADTNGDTLLHVTVQGPGDCMAVATYLMKDKKMDVNRPNSQGLTPLHRAVSSSKNIDVVKFLLQHGAYYNIKCLHGRRPVDISTHEIRSLLVATNSLFKAVKDGDVSKVRRALNDGAAVNAKTHHNDSPLLWAACKGNDSIVDLLLKFQANPNITGKDGNSPLHYACKDSKLNVVLILLGRGANYEPHNDLQRTPFDYATDREVSSLLTLIRGYFSRIYSRKALTAKLRVNLTPEEARALFNCCNVHGKTLLACAMLAGSSFELALRTMFTAEPTKFLVVSDLFHREKFAEAHNIANAELKLRQEWYSRESLMWVDMYEMMTKALYKLERWSETLENQQDIYNLYLDMLGESHKKTLDALGFIGLVMHRVGRNDEALQTFKSILEKGKTVFRAQDQEWLSMKNHMGLVLRDLHRLDEAMALFQEILTVCKKKHGYDHPLTLVAQKNIAMTLASMGEYEESLKLYKIVLERREKVLGPNHSDTMRVKSEIANVLGAQGKRAEAISMHNDFLYHASGALPADHSDIMLGKLNKVWALIENGEHLKALHAYKAVAKYKHAANPYILENINALGRILATLGLIRGDSSYRDMDAEFLGPTSNNEYEILGGDPTRLMSLFQCLRISPDD